LLLRELAFTLPSLFWTRVLGVQCDSGVVWPVWFGTKGPNPKMNHRRQNDRDSRRLRLAAPAIILRDYLPNLIAGYKRRFPDFGLTLHDANQAIAEDLLRKNEIDLAITELEGRPAAFLKSCILMRLPLVLVAPKRSRFQNPEQLFRRQKPSQSLISLPTEEVISKHFQAGLRKVGVVWNAAIEVSSLELIDLYTSLGLGIGLSVAIPRLPTKPALRALQLRKFPTLTIAALWHGDLSEVATTFLTDIKKLAGRFSRGRSG